MSRREIDESRSSSRTRRRCPRRWSSSNPGVAGNGPPPTFARCSL